VSGGRGIVEARGLSKDYGPRRVVTDVTFTLPAGACLGLLGPNGAGKTTTIRMVTCFTVPSAGELHVLGLPVVPAHHARIKARLGIVQQEESLDPDLSVEQNLVVYASYFGIARREATRRAEELMRFTELSDHRAARIRTLSGGMKRRLMLARALLNEPALLVLDEPTTGLDPQARRLVWERIRSLKRGGTTILLTTHYMDEAERLCDRVAIIDHGKVIALGTPRELIASLGVEHVVEFAIAHDGSSLSADTLQRIEGVRTVRRVADAWELAVAQTHRAIPALLDVLQQQRLELAELRTHSATLEDVFVHLTGRQLRDE
jgi:ABC-type multidrug transport system ATPase subunit